MNIFVTVYEAQIGHQPFYYNLSWGIHFLRGYGPFYCKEVQRRCPLPPISLLLQSTCTEPEFVNF
jgi:hypothetical protein